MQAERSHGAAGYDTFTCLRCDLVLSYRQPQKPAKPADNPDRQPQ
jgi:hypothetical protein